MKAQSAFLIAFGLAACTAQVTHPTKTVSEQQVDIDSCTREANHKFWMDPVAALYNAYDCLEAKGYKRVNKAMAAKVEQTVGPSAPRPPRPADAPAAGVAAKPPPKPPAKPGVVEPCRVPCIPHKG
jgi:hypothetical protein